MSEPIKADHSPLPCARIIATNPHWKTVEVDGQVAGFTLTPASPEKEKERKHEPNATDNGHL